MQQQLLYANLNEYTRTAPTEPTYSYTPFSQCTPLVQFMILDVFKTEWPRFLEKSAQKSPTHEECRTQVLAQFDQGNTLYVKSFVSNGALIGCVGIIPTPFGPQMANLFVFPHLRHQGHAKTLLSYGVQKARELDARNNYHTGFVHGWADPHMVPYYIRQGFEPISRLRFLGLYARKSLGSLLLFEDFRK